MTTANNEKEQHKKNMQKLAEKLIKYLQKNDMFHMVNIYVNNQKISSDEPYGKEKPDEKKETKYGSYYVYNNKDVTKIVEYNNPNTITMTFEGPLYHEINYGNGKVENDLNKIFEQYNLYYELGYAWSLAAYPI